MSDLKFALRQLLKNPGFTAVAVLTLALGLGASTAIYRVVDAVLLHPVPGPGSDRLMEIVAPQEDGVSAEALAALRTNEDALPDLAWFHNVVLWTKTDDFRDAVRGELVSPNFFSLWHVPPMLGRTFAPDEGVPLKADRTPERDTVIVLSYAWWQSRFGGDPGIVGKTVELGGCHFTVIGVMPPSFQYPRGWFLSYWLPAQAPQPMPAQAQETGFGVVVRLRDGVRPETAQAALATVAQRLSQAHDTDRPGSSADLRQPRPTLRLTLRPLRDRLASSWRADDLPRTLYGLLGAIAFVMLIVLLNLTNLTLVRTERRQRELAVRAALGAGRFRLARQLVSETVLLACLGGAVGLVMSFWFMRLFVWLLPPTLPRFRAVELDARALGFTLLISLLVGVGLGLAAARRASGAPLTESLKEAGSGATAVRRRRRSRCALVILEVSLTLVLLAGAGLMIQSLRRLFQVSPGFDPQNLLYVNLWLPPQYSDSANPASAAPRRNALLRQLSDRLGALPGVRAVGILGGEVGGANIRIEERAEPISALGVGCGVREGDYFAAMRIPLRAGRFLAAIAGAEGSGAALINESLARLAWPGQNPLGRHFRSTDSARGKRYWVAGIVADVRPLRYTQRAIPTYYCPYGEAEFAYDNPSLTFVVRAARDPWRVVPALLGELRVAEPNLIHPRIIGVRESLDESTQAQRTFMFYLVGFASVGLLLSALGIYGVLAYSVAGRTREIGIRLAVGGRRRDILVLVMWEGSRLVAVGVALGLIGAFWLLQLIRHSVFQTVRTTSVEEGPVSQLLRYQLFQAGGTGLLAWSGAVLLLVAVALLACWLPARRAASTDPMEALRYE